MILHLKKSKIKLLYSILIILSAGYILCCILGNNYRSYYGEQTNFVKGKIIDYKINGDTIQFEIKAKEKVIIFYKFDSQEEKELYINKLSFGDIYSFSGTLEVPSTNTNFNTFSYRKYLLSKKVYYVMQAESMELCKENTSIVYSIKNKIYKFIKKRTTYTYLSLFMFGDNDVMDDNMIQMYRSCGISHLIAVSGMHISLFSAALLLLFKWIKFKWIRYGVVILILWLYAFFIGFTPSVMRAVLSFTAFSILKLKNIKVKSLYVLLWIFILFLIYNPFYIYNTGFLFSFIISFFLLLSKNVLNKYNQYILKVFIISLIAFLAGIPIIGISFYEINLLGPFLNILFVPFISFIVFPSTLFAFFIPLAEPIFEIIIYLLEVIIIFCNKYLVINLVIPKMNIFTIIIYYFLLFIILYKNKLKYIIILIIVLFIYSYQNIFQKYPIVTTIDVGQGDSLLIEFPHNKGNILIDTGGKMNYMVDEWKYKDSKTITEHTLLPFFKSKGIHHLDYLILTHGDYDHMGETINLVNNFKVEKVIFNCGEFNDLEQDLIKVLDKKKIKYYSCIKELNIDNNKLYFLNNGDYGNENDNSSVIYTELNNHKFLFMGDAGVEVEEDLVEKYNLKDIDVLKVGHHGSRTSSGKSFIDEINPKYSIISVGKNNRYGHPNDSVLDNLEDSQIYRTDWDGSIMFKVNKDKLKIETCTP